MAKRASTACLRRDCCFRTSSARPVSRYCQKYDVRRSWLQKTVLLDGLVRSLRNTGGDQAADDTEYQKALAVPELRKKLDDLGMAPMPLTQPRFEKLVKHEIDTYTG